MCNDVPAEEQHIPSVQPRLSGVECSVVPWSRFVIGSALTYIQFSTASDNCWGEKAWVRG